jgi:hypothetical protein
MTKFSEVPAAGITIRESANDGSDFTNPAADYRRLFLGEDGQLHAKDSAGTVAAIGAGDITTDAAWAAKGDLIAGTANNTAAILTAGTNGKVLTAASGEATGLKWDTVAAGALTYATSTLSGGVVTLNTSTFTDVLSLGSLAAGTWLLMCTLQASLTSTAGIGVKVWDGTNIFGSADTVVVAANPQRAMLAVTCVAVLGSPATVKVSGLAVAANGTISDVTITGSIEKASNMVGIKIA